MTDAELPARMRERSGRPRMDTLLLIGAEGRNAGKTAFACAVIGKFARGRPLVGVKVTTVDGQAGPCPRGGAGCGACASLEGPFCITEERDPPAGADTARMLASGAARVFWVRSRADSLAACLVALRERIGPDALVVAESNSLARVVEPGVFVMVREAGSRRPKPSARAVLDLADRVVVSHGGAFDLDLDDLVVYDGAWRLQEASAVVLAGGASTRMRTDKGLLPVGDRPLVLHVVDQLRGRFREVLVSANDPAAYAFTGLPVVRDREPGQGPLMGIASALEASRSDTLFVVACDIPEVDLPLARRLLAEASQYDCVVPRLGPDLLEPLFAVYRRSALPAIREALAAGERKIRRVFPRLRVRTVDAGDEARLENLNAPADLASWLARRGDAARTP